MSNLIVALLTLAFWVILGFLIVIAMFRLIEKEWPLFLQNLLVKKYRHEYKGVKIKVTVSNEKVMESSKYYVHLKLGKNKRKQTVFADPGGITAQINTEVEKFIKDLKNEKWKKELEDWELQTLFDEEITDEETEEDKGPDKPSSPKKKYDMDLIEVFTESKNHPGEDYAISLGGWRSMVIRYTKAGTHSHPYVPYDMSFWHVIPPNSGKAFIFRDENRWDLVE